MVGTPRRRCPIFYARHSIQHLPRFGFLIEIPSNEVMLKVMKRLLLCLFLATTSLHASDIWGTDYPAALTQASSSKKPILLEFTGSDWCPPCMKLTKDVFEQPAFEDFAKKNLVLVKFDFPRAKEQSAELKAANEALSQKYQVEGFPTLILLDSTGKEVARIVGYQLRTPEAFLKWVQDNQK
jgi:protein disulfide-isomerase